MKKFFTVFLMMLSIFCLTSCSNDKEKLINESEEYLITNLKDPSSYERIEVKINDTITNLESAQKALRLYQFEYDLTKKTYEDFKKYDNGYFKDKFMEADSTYKMYLKNIENVKNSKEANDIKEIIIGFKYRTKNSMGAYDIYLTVLVYKPQELEKERRFTLHCLPK